MKINILILLILINTINSCGQKKMENRFNAWDNFVDNLGKEMVSAGDVHNNMVKSGLKDNFLTKMDFMFIYSNRLYRETAQVNIKIIAFHVIGIKRKK